MDIVKVKTAEGRFVRDPGTLRPLAPEGVEVDRDDPFWFRRIADADVVTVDEAPAVPAKRFSSKEA